MLIAQRWVCVADRTLALRRRSTVSSHSVKKSWARFVLCGDSATTGSSSSGVRVAENTSTTYVHQKLFSHASISAYASSWVFIIIIIIILF